MIKFKGRKIIVTEQIWKEGKMYVSFCPELDVASCGNTPVKARMNLKEALQILIEETTRMGTLREILEETGYNLAGDSELITRRREIIEFDAIPVSLS